MGYLVVGVGMVWWKVVLNIVIWGIFFNINSVLIVLMFFRWVGLWVGVRGIKFVMVCCIFGVIKVVLVWFVFLWIIWWFIRLIFVKFFNIVLFFVIRVFNIWVIFCWRLLVFRMIICFWLVVFIVNCFWFVNIV